MTLCVNCEETGAEHCNVVLTDYIHPYIDRCHNVLDTNQRCCVSNIRDFAIAYISKSVIVLHAMNQAVYSLGRISASQVFSTTPPPFHHFQLQKMPSSSGHQAEQPSSIQIIPNPPEMSPINLPLPSHSDKPETNLVSRNPSALPGPQTARSDFMPTGKGRGSLAASQLSFSETPTLAHLPSLF